MTRSHRTKPPAVTTSTLAEIAAELGRDRLYLLGWMKRFELPPGHGNRYLATYLSFFRTVVFLKLAQIPEEKLVELWTLEKKLMNLLHVDTSSSPTWMIDGHTATGNDSRRLFLSRFDIGTDLQSACVQPGLDFSPAPAELFGGRDMGEDALRLLGIYLAELKPVLATVASQSALLGEAARWAGRIGKRI
jgi:hypothetical protein